MTDDADSSGWYEGTDPDTLNGARDAIERGSADTPADWPGRAVDTGFVADEDGYYEALHEATVATARERAREQERAGDQQLKHGVRAMDDCRRQANELVGRVAEWGGSRDADAGTGA